MASTMDSFNAVALWSMILPAATAAGGGRSGKNAPRQYSQLQISEMMLAPPAQKVHVVVNDVVWC